MLFYGLDFLTLLNRLQDSLYLMVPEIALESTGNSVDLAV